MMPRVNTRSSSRFGLSNVQKPSMSSNDENKRRGNVKMALKDNSNILGGLKRKADSNIENMPPKKRSVLGDVTNAFEKKIPYNRKDANKPSLQKKCTEAMNKENIRNNIQSNKKKGLSSATGHLASVTTLPKQATTIKNNIRAPIAEEEMVDLEDSVEADLLEGLDYCSALPSSQESNASQSAAAVKGFDSSSYVTACESSHLALELDSIIEEEEEVSEAKIRELSPEKLDPVPNGVEDYDNECLSDPYAAALYVSDIFHYYKLREKDFVIEKYLDKQPDITESMRAILVDWMVEVQESFELNHETLYLAVKLIDIFLSRQVIKRDQLQLVGSTAIFIACKFDERIPPYIDDFLYICDDAYKRRELILYEIKMLKTVGYDLGIPLSYRFLRRYARCARVSMEQLTLARFILEMSLMEYAIIDASDSSVAAAALLLARYCTTPASQRADCWTPTLQHYSGLSVADILHLTHTLHTMISGPPHEKLSTIRNKYSHPVFYEVGKTPIPETLDLKV